MDDASLFSDFKVEDVNEFSWADEFLDGIQSEDHNALEKLASEIDLPGEPETLSVLGQQLIQQQGIMGGQVHVQIPTHLQGSVPTTNLQQTNSSICGDGVAHLTPSASSSLNNSFQQTPQSHMTQQQTAQQNSAKFVQIPHNFSVGSVQQMHNTVPLQTFMPSSQAIYQGQGNLFPTQGSVHIENPKVVNVNFGPHVIGSDGGSQQASLIQTAEGKQVFITTSQLQQMSQSLGLTQPLVAGAQLINQGVRTTLAQGVQQPVNQTARQIVLPSGQTVIPRQADPVAGKNVLLRQINPSSLIYPAGQGALITSSGQGLQVVNTSSGQGNQVQLIQQGQQLNQTSLMNLLNNQGLLSNGLVSAGQNILVNGQLVNLGQLQQLSNLQLQQQQQQQQGSIGSVGGVTLAHALRQIPGQTLQQAGPASQQQLIMQSGAGTQQHQQQLILQSGAGTQQLQGQILLQQQKVPGMKLGRTVTPNNQGSNSSTPVATPTPSTPTPTPTPDPMLKDNGQLSNILEQALSMSKIDLQSFDDDDFSMLGISDECLTSTTPTPPTVLPTPTPKPKAKPKKQTKKQKTAAAAATQVISTITSQPSKQTKSVQIVQTTQNQNVSVNPQQKVIASNGQVYVLSKNGQQFVLQQQSNTTTTSVTNIAPQLKPIPSIPAPTVISSSNIPTSHINGNIPIRNPVSTTRTINSRTKNVVTTAVITQQNVIVSPQRQVTDSKAYVKANSETTTCVKSGPPTAPKGTIGFLQTLPKAASSCFTPQTNQLPTIQVKAQKISTLGGSYVKQEPVLIKQEPAFEDIPQTISGGSIPVSTQPSALGGIPQTISGSSIPVSTMPVISTASTNQLMTTQYHPTTMMTSLQSGNTSLTPTHTVSSISTCTKSNMKEKDASTIKTMTPINIGKSTLMLSLTPGEKERLEDHLSKMTMQEQTVFLAHQQRISKRIQQVQQEQQHKTNQQQEQQHKTIQQQEHQLKTMQQQEHPHKTMQQHTQQPSTKHVTTQPQQIKKQKQSTKKQHQQLQNTAVLSSSSPSPTVLDAPPEQAVRSSQQTQQQSPVTSICCSGPTPPTQTMTSSMVPTTVEEVDVEKVDVKPLAQPAQQKQSFLMMNSQQHIAHKRQGLAPPILQQLNRCLAEQQLVKDRSLAVNPEVKTPFKNYSDAMRRLVRYHTLQDHKPPEESKTIKSWDTKYNKLCDYLMKKKRYYLRRYNKMKLYNDMCPEKRPESLQNLLCFNEQLQDLFEKEKEMAKSHPELFEPIDPTRQAPSVSPSHIERKYSTQTSLSPHHSKEAIANDRMEEHQQASLSSLKRKACADSTGTLKFVFKRRTTDDFSVKKSSGVLNLKAVVNVDKSDSEYEFDSSVHTSHSVTVRRRTNSLLTSDNKSDYSDDGEASDEEESLSGSEVDKDSDNNDDSQTETSIEDRINSDGSRGKCVSFETSIEQGREASYNDRGSYNRLSENRKSVFKFSDISSADTGSLSSGKKSCRRLSHAASINSVASDDVFASTSCEDLRQHAPVSSIGSCLLETSNVLTPSSISPSSLAHTFVDDSPSTSRCVLPRPAQLTSEISGTSCASPIEREAARKGLPAPCLFSTPSKNLLQTDAMFCSSSEDDDDDNVGSDSLINRFKIDNKDPQSSMINASVTSAINRVLNEDDDNDCSMFGLSPNSDLEAAVQSILNG